MTREPGGTPAGEILRSVILQGEPGSALDPSTELLLYLADRAEHLTRIVRPSLQAGKTVISDRALDSTLAYQGKGRRFGISWLIQIHEQLQLWYPPHLTIFLDVPPEIGLRRKKRTDAYEWYRFEKENITFHQNVYEGYLELMRRFPERFIRIDGCGEPDVVWNNLVQAFMNRIQEPSPRAK